ncbi:NAD-dependent deacetylase [Halanaerobium saccharolyticum]|jgi:NAD-dependent deacetylase|uniref:protein acetyllysine N-acetyltransferase n=1 Tax=Halanaerobium saccharolyticum TaxID=43595 RepID=A0A2T5RI11_9FIRM|nr:MULTISPECIES: NAD-dependent deacylase [Halanaerobium]PTV97797.1 NAD-dependent deacetylase [Halanaerobium saccharolyticum]PUU89684.1 MAG: NAD-dependent deacetylase [Halanaerobium sp.]PUU89788.1 MAG: NAD-dependent deacetylase [Halanaerobium sp.]TDP88670.1 NAD-dependent deacetylase [Halanaerobium saccharolyticum]
MKEYQKAADLIRHSRHVTVFTGAGVSVESGVPPFRGENGLWNEYDPIILDLKNFYKNPEESWVTIKKIFYDYFGKAEPNAAHRVIARLEADGYVQAVITQNIDNLHQEAGSKNVFEFHGNSRELVCTECGAKYPVTEEILQKLPPKCEKCGEILKPDFVFFGEAIPDQAEKLSFEEAEKADLFIVIGTTGEVQPASLIPVVARSKGAKIIEINIKKSNFTDDITDLFIQEKASLAMKKIEAELYK